MSKVHRFFKRYSYGMYIGFALGYFWNGYWNQWQFYATLIPLIILVSWSQSTNE